MSPLVLDNSRVWQMSGRSEIALLVFRAVLLRPQKFKLLWGIAIYCDGSLVCGWLQEMFRLERALLKINPSLVRISEASFGQLFGILAADLHAE